MRGIRQFFLVAILMFCATSGMAVGVAVDCAAGDKIQDAIAANLTAPKLMIAISGICVENVEIRRDNVTLRGTNPNFDGIEAADKTKAFSAALFIRDARNIKVVSLGLKGGNSAGLRVENAWRRIVATNCLFTENSAYGVVVVDGALTVTNSKITDNRRGGIAAQGGGIVTCKSCEILDNPDLADGVALNTSDSSSISVRNSSIAGSRIGAVATRHSAVNFYNSSLEADLFAIYARDHSNVNFSESLFTGAITLSGYSSGRISDSVQTSGSLPLISVQRNSSLRTQSSVPGGTSLADNLNVLSFSNGENSGETIFQEISCTTGSDFICTGEEVIIASDCGLCP